MKKFIVVAAMLLAGAACSKKVLPVNTANVGASSVVQNANAAVPVPAATRSVSATDIPGADPAFSFSAEIPSAWQVEAVAATQAINVYDPSLSASSNLERSRVFIRFFRASSFLTLTTVDIKSRTETTVGGRPAVTYVIEKRAGVPDFANQPSWRSQEHRVTDVRSTDASPTTFYVFGKRPDLDGATFEAFLASLKFGEQKTSVGYPMEGFVDRITKKRFAQYITPSNSPVQPERFSGYHTGVDAETTEAEVSVDVPVFAVADGTIAVRRTADGYGGVVLVTHVVEGETVTAVYGHVRLASVTKRVGDSVEQGEGIGVLGAGYSSETDGERKHLHFALLKGKSTTLLGYVQSKSALTAWVDPMTWLQGRNAAEPG